MKVTYPTRCQIVDVTGGKVGPLAIHTPDASRPHVGKLGTAYNDIDADGCESVHIELDDGAVLHGCECWWVPLASDEEAPATVKP